MCPRPSWKDQPPNAPWHPESPPAWLAGRMRRRRFFLVRLAFMFGGSLIFALIVLSAILSRVLRGPGEIAPHLPGIVPFIFVIPVVFFILSGIFGAFLFRRIGSPALEVMAAADAVAEGDFSVRVRENIPGEFGQLARSFNRMTAELERSEQQRRNLSADVAHELRTPLHIIQGNLEGILDGVYQPTGEHIAATLEETHLLARLVNDLQTLSLAEAGQLPLHKTEFPAGDLLEDIVTSFSGQATEAGVVLAVEPIPEDEMLSLYADADRIDQVLSNLVSNALRHTPTGGRITLSANPIENGLRLTVRDTGTGIAPEELPYIFDRFWRGDRARTRHPGSGSGLGLAITRQLVQAHGGKISVESTPGQGSVFYIDLYR